MMSKFGYKVVQYQIDGNKVAQYDSASLASEATGVNSSAILGCCNHKYGYKTAGGYIWRFFNESYSYDDSYHIIWLKDTVYSGEFLSFEDAAIAAYGKATKINKNTIGQCCHGHLKHNKRNYFFFKKDYKIMNT